MALVGPSGRKWVTDEAQYMATSSPMGRQADKGNDVTGAHCYTRKYSWEKHAIEQCNCCRMHAQRPFTTYVFVICTIEANKGDATGMARSGLGLQLVIQIIV